ncbi:cytochrome c peroxidase [Chitinophaga nivalis]|uniref:Cytochrome C peroxidase n=1 Tax=Chitinophaga nivalis TaxID=2991709 RepID=A0ABT3IP71_9BACT|nr:cytochrome c peroxidase [Chitinophaga nivalis]MCW3464544.1 cytochrome C peroxidase [Chitinophaga nivalis]MCW3485765.1 cytochrome C peroxidase [Chitinophaga nivalis]
MKTRIIAAWILWMTAVNLYSAPAPITGKEAGLLEIQFRQQLHTVADSLAMLQQALRAKAAPQHIRQRFAASRRAYKHTEFLIEYYYPHLIRVINGPALPFADGENSRAVLPPEGFQLIEEKLFSGGNSIDHRQVLALTTALREQVLSLQEESDPYGFMDPYIFDAMRFEIYRIIALGISGYDSPIALHSMSEAAAALQGVATALQLYASRLNDPQLLQQTVSRFQAARAYLLQPTAFNQFDRLHFITHHANPLSTLLLQWQQQLSLQVPAERRILSPDAPHLFAMAYYNANGYTPNKESDPTPEKTALGKKLFYDPLLSGNRQRSCASCHQPERAFTDGLAKSPALDGGGTIARNTPTLLNVGFQSQLFYDSRSMFIESQVADVVHNKKEMGGSLELAVQQLKKDTAYTALFERAFNYTPSAVSEENITNAIASYLRSLTSLESRFDRYMNGDTTTLTATEKKGFNIFMGKGKCGTCHFAPLFNGVAPPYFAEPESEVLGVPVNDHPKTRLDDDPGKYVLYRVPIQRYAFKTQSVRNSMLTAPYMHNGVFRTMEQVIDFYDKGGGAGLGIAPDNQTLPTDQLRLNRQEKQALIAFMHSLTDTTSYKKQTGSY